MSRTHPHEPRDGRRYQRRSTATPADRARDGGPAVFLWLFALLIAEAALFLWLLERGYQQ
jgi:hypothetical protein